MKHIYIISIIVFGLSFTGIELFAQPIPGGSGGHGSTQNQSGGAAPLDGGLSVLLLLSATFAVKKIVKNRKKEITTTKN